MSSSSECGCDDSKRLRAELERVTRERDYLLEFVDPKEVLQMQRELADEAASEVA